MCEYGQVAPCSTLRHMSTSFSIAICAPLASSRTALPPPPPNDRGIDRIVPAAARERAGRHEGGCGAERQMGPCDVARCLCPPEPFALNPATAKYILQYLAQSRVSLHLHDSLPTCTSVLAYHNHISTPLYFSGDTQRNQSLFRITHISSISALPPREAAHLPVVIPSTTI